MRNWRWKTDQWPRGSPGGFESQRSEGWQRSGKKGIGERETFSVWEAEKQQNLKLITSQVWWTGRIQSALASPLFSVQTRLLR